MDCEITNMIMIENPETGEVLVQNRVLSWQGITFPGGHVDKGESFLESAIREVKEETGLDVYDLKLCGTVHWCHKDTDNRYIVFLYKTDSYSGQMIDATEEGQVFWVKKDELSDMKLSPNFREYLAIFFGSSQTEAFGLWRENEDDEMRIL